MASEQLVTPAKLATVQLVKAESRVRLALWLAEKFTGGDIVRLAPGATVAIEGADKLSATYGCANWLSGAASGALYAFRTLRIPRQRVMLTELSGRLRSGDMEAIANAAAIGIAGLVERELVVRTDGWTAEVLSDEKAADVNRAVAGMCDHGPVVSGLTEQAPEQSGSEGMAAESRASAGK